MNRLKLPSASLAANVSISQVINVDELDGVQALSQLADVEMIFVPLPESTTADARAALRVMAFAIRLEVPGHPRISALRFKMRNVERRVWAIDARHAEPALYLESHSGNSYKSSTINPVASLPRMHEA